MEVPRDAIHYLVDPEGKPTAVQVNWYTWLRIVSALEDAEDIAMAQAALAELDAAGGSPESAGWLRLEDLEKEWGKK